MQPTQFIPIGNGSVIAGLPDGISYDFDDEGTLVAWLDSAPDLLALRVSCIVAIPKSDDVPTMNESVIEDAREKGLQVFHAGDKAYCISDEHGEENGEPIWVRFWEAGFSHNRVIFSLCCPEKSKDSKEAATICRLVPEIIATLKQRETHSDLSESEQHDLDAQREAIREFLQERYNAFSLPAVRADLPVLQQIIDEDIFTAEQEAEWSCVGVVFGDILAAELGLRWCVFSDEQGAEPALRLDDTSITIFPRSMIRKRIESGEEIDLDAFLGNIAANIEELKAEGC